MNTLIEKNASFYKLCSILTPMEKVAYKSTDNSDTPHNDTGDFKDPSAAAGAVKQTADEHLGIKDPNVVVANPPNEIRSYPTKTTP